MGDVNAGDLVLLSTRASATTLLTTSVRFRIHEFPVCWTPCDAKAVCDTLVYFMIARISGGKYGTF